MLDEGEELGRLDRFVHGTVEELEEQLDTILARSTDGIAWKDLMVADTKFVSYLSVHLLFPGTS